MDEIYYSHFIRHDERSRVTHCFSDAFEEPVDGDRLHNNQGGRHVRLILIGGSVTEENPAIFDEWGVPLFELAGPCVRRRTPEEIEADRPDPPLPQADTHEFTLGLMGVAGEGEFEGERLEGDEFRHDAFRSTEVGSAGWQRAQCRLCDL